MAFDFKKEYKALYLPPTAPTIAQVPPAHYLAVRGQGDPNEEGGAYQAAVGQLYGVAYTLKMSPRAGYAMDGFYDYVVPPLEGFWWQEGVSGIEYARKQDFHWISVIRLPAFVTAADVSWAVNEAARKKKADFSAVTFFPYDEGLCVQCMHIGSFDDEPATMEAMHRFAESQGYAVDITDTRMHHEIYLSDPRKTSPAQRKTVLRHPIKKE